MTSLSWRPGSSGLTLSVLMRSALAFSSLIRDMSFAVALDRISSLLSCTDCEWSTPKRLWFGHGLRLWCIVGAVVLGAPKPVRDPVPILLLTLAAACQKPNEEARCPPFAPETELSVPIVPITVIRRGLPFGYVSSRSLCAERLFSSHRLMRSDMRTAFALAKLGARTLLLTMTALLPRPTGESTSFADQCPRIGTYSRGTCRCIGRLLVEAGT